ncbi:MAG TPA: diguanylate cyclase [Deinococcales bacterium]|nr:diguanylate cyclase [Deinococcales bacterium]
MKDGGRPATTVLLLLGAAAAIALAAYIAGAAGAGIALAAVAALTAALATRANGRVARAERALAAEHDFSQTLMDALGQGVTLVDEAGRFQYVNDAYARLVGLRARDLIGRTPYDVTAPEDHAILRDARSARQRGEGNSYETSLRRPDGKRVPVLVTAVPRQQGGRNVGALAIVTDLSERYAAEARLEAQANDLRDALRYAQALEEVSRLLEEAGDPEEVPRRAVRVIAEVARLDWAGLAVVEENTTFTREVWRAKKVGDALAQAVAKPHDRNGGLVWKAFDSGTPVFVDDYRTEVDGQASVVELGVAAAAFIPIANGSSRRGLVFIAARLGTDQPWRERDRTLFSAAARSVQVALERHRHTLELEVAARTDKLTGLGNRRAFEDDLEVAMASAERQAQVLSVLIIDMDGLKVVNDTLGHDRGDALLTAFARALETEFGGEDRVYRLGGDEFAAILPRLAPAAHPVVRDRVNRAVSAVRAAGFQGAEASAGLAVFPADDTRPGELVRLADVRLYQEKHGKRPADAAPA